MTHEGIISENLANEVANEMDNEMSNEMANEGAGTLSDELSDQTPTPNNILDLGQIREQTAAAIAELLASCKLEPGDMVVVGGSSSEVRGAFPGQASSAEIGQAIITEIHRQVRDAGLQLAVQCCEHLNRALVVEHSWARERHIPTVNALPQLHAGGSFAVAAWSLAKAPCLIESIEASVGLDIGLVMIGMHMRPVAVPIRLGVSKIGNAIINAAYSRDKLIGGERAKYL